MIRSRVNFTEADRDQNVRGIASRARDCLQMYYRPFGFHGLWAYAAHRILGWPKEIAVQPAGIRHPVHLRVRTSDVSGCDKILRCGQYAIDLPFAPKVIVDAGANIGMASIYYAHRYPDARIIALEPEASNFAVLSRNVEPYPNIRPVNAALWYKDGEIALRSTGLPSDKVGFVVHEGEGSPTRALTLPTLMKEMHIPSIDILKVDIEGAEKEVFESCDWMDRVQCLVIELHDRLKPGCSAAASYVTRDFLASQKGEATIYIRNPITASPEIQAKPRVHEE